MKARVFQLFEVCQHEFANFSFPCETGKQENKLVLPNDHSSFPRIPTHLKSVCTKSYCSEITASALFVYFLQPAIPSLFSGYILIIFTNQLLA